ncbi:hypothetical protein T440DRAFT_479887 [Plenodomus tracheiphilus IPT5]|uniref:Uncharacterized protein n=1 Tax=Plenodomus tracheiphilus IPT5 TaxID=1408161 RepID=A0A6A7B4W8_9PLEO|nr:hypothetical protein T440DRAFT_479887 [Plenodomus tracheiphilus IPT5]
MWGIKKPPHRVRFPHPHPKGYSAQPRLQPTETSTSDLTAPIGFVNNINYLNSQIAINHVNQQFTRLVLWWYDSRLGYTQAQFARGPAFESRQDPFFFADLMDCSLVFLRRETCIRLCSALSVPTSTKAIYTNQLCAVISLAEDLVSSGLHAALAAVST